VDELNSALGMARAFAADSFVRDNVLLVQKDLVALMGELATQFEDLERYSKDGFPRLTPDLTVKLDRLAAEIESQNITYAGWATPGETPSSAALDMARTVCRRAERHVCALQIESQLGNAEIIIYLNRLSDVLWLLARWAESRK
jgi:cob(I)alamin adenosyltransferase